MAHLVHDLLQRQSSIDVGNGHNKLASGQSRGAKYSHTGHFVTMQVLDTSTALVVPITTPDGRIVEKASFQYLHIR